MDTLSAISGLPTSHLGASPSRPTSPSGTSAAGPVDTHQAGVDAGLADVTARGIQSTQDSAGSNSSDHKDPSGNKQHVEQAVKDINDFFQTMRRSLQFKLDQDSGKMVVQIKDADTDEVIRQIPPEYVLKLAKQLGEVKGLLFEEKA